MKVATEHHIRLALAFILSMCPFWQPMVLGLETSLLSQGDPNHALLEIPFTTYHLGSIRPGSKPVAVFAFRNIGKKVLEIANVKKCCGAVVELSHEKLQAGQSGFLRATYRAGQNPGIFKKTITFDTNDPQHSHVILTTIGLIRPTLTWEPKQLTISQVGDKVICPAIHLKSLDNCPISIKSATSTGNSLTVEFAPNYFAKEISLTPKWNGDLQKFSFNQGGIIQILLNQKDNLIINLPFTLVPPIQVTPSQIIAFGVVPNQSLEEKLTLKQTQADANAVGLKSIRSIDSQKGIPVKITKVTQNGTRCDVQLEIMPKKFSDNPHFLSDHLTLHLSDNSILDVPMRLFYKSALK